MGQCGCGEFEPDYVVPAPDGGVYAITLYRGCDDCENPVGVFVDYLTPDEMEDWDIQPDQIINLARRAAGMRKLTIPVMSMSGIMEASRKGHHEFAGIGDWLAVDPANATEEQKLDYGTIADAMKDGGYDFLSAIVGATAAEYPEVSPEAECKKGPTPAAPRDAGRPAGG